MPKSVGGKPGEAERKRKRLPQTQRSTSEYRERIATPPKPTLDTTTFKVKWLKNSRVYRCYGCRQNIRPKPQKGEAEVVPPPPWDFVLARLELRPIPNGDGGLTTTTTTTTTFIHTFKDVHQAGASALSSKVVLHSQRPQQKVSSVGRSNGS